MLLLASPAGAQRIRVTTQTVPLYVTVTDEQKRLVPDLAKEDFEVYDNGKLQTLTNFDNQPTPITVVVMLDTSGSMTLALDLVKEGAEQFLMRMLPIDKGMVGAFNDKIEFHPGVVHRQSRSAGARVEGARLRVSDAPVRRGRPEHRAAERRARGARRDGVHRRRRQRQPQGLGHSASIGRALEEVMVYSIGLENEYFNGQQRVRSSPDRSLRKLSEETGGGFFLLKKKDDLGPTFTRVAQELHSQYVLGFSPEILDGKVHKLEVRLKRPGMVPRARKSYVAGRAETTQK